MHGSLRYGLSDNNLLGSSCIPVISYSVHWNRNVSLLLGSTQKSCNNRSNSLHAWRHPISYSCSFTSLYSNLILLLWIRIVATYPVYHEHVSLGFCLILFNFHPRVTIIACMWHVLEVVGTQIDTTWLVSDAHPRGKNITNLYLDKECYNSPKESSDLKTCEWGLTIYSFHSGWSSGRLKEIPNVRGKMCLM